MDEDAARRVGPFVLEARLAQGGTGQVWRARHVRSGLPVAVKLLRSEGSPFQRASMEVEVAALAGLDHPSIVRILDQGHTLTAMGALPAGTPWLAMELVQGGTLAQRAATVRWPEVKAMLEQVLEALSHAHARRVLHRDLKPGNVLWHDGVRPCWKLGDFGLALGDHTPRAHHGITPSYSAPEQLAATTQGPWTDLYALAACTWHVVTGQPVFTGTREEVARAHVEQDPPTFEPLFEVPAGLEDWLRELLRKRGSDRPQLAADAAAMLRGFLADASGDGDQGDTLEVGTAGLPLGARRRLRPWQQPGLGRRERLQGAGLELFALRAPPMVGRHVERDMLWGLLELVYTDRHAAAAALVTGPRGMGATRLCQWVGLRAAELGLASFVHLPAGADAVRLVESLPTPRPGERPVVLLVDDVVPQPWVLREAQRRLDESTTPLLLLLTAERSSLQQSPEVDALWVAAASHPRATELTLGPLDNEELDELLDGMLPLEPSLRAELRVRCRGVPGLLVAVLRDCVERGVLVEGEEGMMLAEGEVLAPLKGIAERRLKALWADLDAPSRRGLVALAVLGDGVDLLQWQRVQPTNQGLVVTLLRLGHVTVVGRRLRFVDPAFAEAVLAAAGDVTELHSRAAEVRREEGAPPHVVGEHLLRAGRLEEACDALLTGASGLHVRGDTAGSLVALELAREALDALEAPPSGPRWNLYWRSRCASLARAGESSHAAAAGRRAVRLAREAGDPQLLVKCLRALASTLVMGGEVGRAEEVLDEAVKGLAAAPTLTARVHVQLCELYNATGQHARVPATAGHALVHADRYEGADNTRAWALHHLAYALHRLGRSAEARVCIDQAMGIARARPVALAGLHSVLGDIARSEGDLDAAEAFYMEAVALLRPMSTPDVAIYRLNLALVACRRGHWDLAIERAERARLDLAGVAWSVLVAYTHATLLWPLAALQRWPAFDRALKEASRAADSGCTEADIVEVLCEVHTLIPEAFVARRGKVASLRDRLARRLASPGQDAAGS